MKATNIDISAATNIEEVLETANGNWSVEQHQLMTQTGISVDSHKSIIRADTQTVLGVVGNNYQPIDNSTAFAFFDQIVKQEKATFKNYSEIDGGKRIIVEASLGQFEAKVGDICEKRVKMINSFNGVNSFTVSFEALRLVCTNGMTRTEKESAIKVRHTKNHVSKIEEAMQVLGYSKRSYEQFEDQCRILAQKNVNKAMVDKFLEDLFMEKPGDKISKRRQNTKDEITRLFESGKGNEGKTAWDLYNGTTEYYDHFHNDGKDAEIALASQLVGSVRDHKTRALNLALAL